MYYAFKIDFLSLPAGAKGIICSNLVSKARPGQLPYFDEFVQHLLKPDEWKQWNSKGLGQTSTPNPSLGWKELTPGKPESWRAKGIPNLNVQNLIPNRFPKGKATSYGPILQAVTEAVQAARDRPGKSGVDRTQMLGEMKKCGDAAVQGRWRDIQDYKIADFNRHFAQHGLKAVTAKKTMPDGEVVDQFDAFGTVKTAPNIDLENLMRDWIVKYGSDSSLEENAKQKQMAKTHSAAMQFQARSNRIISRNKGCSNW